MAAHCAVVTLFNNPTRRLDVTGRAVAIDLGVIIKKKLQDIPFPVRVFTRGTRRHLTFTRPKDWPALSSTAK